jgi:GT2 family glycosyltransferase
VTGCWVIVLTWNGKDDTLELLADLSAAVGPDDRVLVVDNASDDGTLEAIHGAFPTVLTLQTGDNLGYAGGNNRGLHVALTEGPSHICVLNNDTRVEPGFLEPLISVASTLRAAVSPDIRYDDGRDGSWFRGGVIDTRSGCARHLFGAEQVPDAEPFTTEIITGCCIVASAEVWREVGGFDESLYLTFEDSDWSCRARAVGVSLMVVPASIIVHKVSRSFTGVAAPLGTYYFTRNGFRFAGKWIGRRGQLAFLKSWVVLPVLRGIKRRSLGPGDVIMRLVGAAAGVTGRGGSAGAVPRHLAARVVRRRA